MTCPTRRHLGPDRNWRPLRAAKGVIANGLFFMMSLAHAAAPAPPESTRDAVHELLTQGFEAMKQGDYQRAEESLSKARAIEPEQPFVLLNLGSVYAKQCRIDEARTLFERVANGSEEVVAVDSRTSPEQFAAVAIGATSAQVNQGMLGRSPAYIARYNLAHVRPCTTVASVVPGVSSVPVPAPFSHRVVLAASELFEFDTARLRLAQPQLDRIAEALKRHPEIEQVVINGHTDELGSPDYNAVLSMRRANAARAYLVSIGIDDRRLVARGWGAAQPVVRCPGSRGDALVQCLAPNRRMEIEPITLNDVSP